MGSRFMQGFPRPSLQKSFLRGENRDKFALFSYGLASRAKREAMHGNVFTALRAQLFSLDEKVSSFRGISLLIGFKCNGKSKEKKRKAFC